MRKSAISPIGKWEIKKNKAETVNAEHVQTFFFFFFSLPEGYRYITCEWIYTETANNVSGSQE